MKSVDKNAARSDEWNIDSLPVLQVTPAVLAGRNFRHYTCAVRDPVQPCAYLFTGLDLQEETGEEPEPENSLELSSEDCVTDWDFAADQEQRPASLYDLLPDDCWVKRYADDYSTDTCRLVYLVTDTEGNITDSGCLLEDARRCSGGGEWLGVPGIELPTEKTYSYTSDLPEKIIRDLCLLFAGEALPLSFTFSGKPLPRRLKDGMKPEDHQYIFALPSTLRQAFSHMTVDLDEQNIIRTLTLTTWQRSGSSFGDLFYQPMSLADRQEETMNALLFLYDSYTKEEKQSF